LVSNLLKADCYCFVVKWAILGNGNKFMDIKFLLSAVFAYVAVVFLATKPAFGAMRKNLGNILFLLNTGHV
jgi:hypothetical protein